MRAGAEPLCPLDGSTYYKMKPSSLSQLQDEDEDDSVGFSSSEM